MIGGEGDPQSFSALRHRGITYGRDKNALLLQTTAPVVGGFRGVGTNGDDRALRFNVHLSQGPDQGPEMLDVFPEGRAALGCLVARKPLDRG